MLLQTAGDDHAASVVGVASAIASDIAYAIAYATVYAIASVSSSNM
jgi:hypothetical protein